MLYFILALQQKSLLENDLKISLNYIFFTKLFSFHKIISKIHKNRKKEPEWTLSMYGALSM